MGELGIPGVAELEKAGVRELALDELTQPYIQSPRLTMELYTRHVKDETVDPDEEFLYHVPADIFGKVSLHRSLNLSCNLIAEKIPTGTSVLYFNCHNKKCFNLRSSIESSPCHA